MIYLSNKWGAFIIEGKTKQEIHREFKKKGIRQNMSRKGNCLANELFRPAQK
ncbi:hypothetical protein CLOSTMETH_00927 [[Clostridium] methylpentosum DSM 5476]|uniref:Uncharacterized protein n=1 Tax=[Clostridium] methylpentosum DSM 5476 TaxID=537013 RepID=C0EAR3_9FIRM|nr:hypothetical protein CLOSTMETH_00927 [[Clostridium] methylpentosum DSM 5476]